MIGRRGVLAAAVAGAGGIAFGGSLWRGAFAGTAVRAAGPYGPLRPADSNGIRLPGGFTSRLVAESGHTVPGTGYTWHGAPDGGACFPVDGGGWIYASNSEIDGGAGGAGALRFDADGTIADAYRILAGTDRNCAGGPTPWGTWLSCEEVGRGRVFETDPYGREQAVERPAMGRFVHEAAAVDPERRVVYLTEDEGGGCFYRFVPSSWPDLAAGRLEVLVADADEGPVRWAEVPDPAAREAPTKDQVAGAKRFERGEGCSYARGVCYFTTTGDNRVWAYRAGTQELTVLYQRDDPLTGVDNVTVSASDDVFVAEDGGNMEVCLIEPGGAVSPFLRIEGQGSSEICGPAFSPDGRRLYLSSQRGRTGDLRDGLTYEIAGPFRGPATG